MIHVGDLIRDELVSQGRSVQWLADKLCMDRTNMYRILKKPYIDSCFLYRISLFLNHNFFLDLADDVHLMLKK